MAVESFLEANPMHRSWIETERPLTRRVEIRTDTWRPWLGVGGYPGRRSYCGHPPADIASAALNVLSGFPNVESTLRRDRYVDRRELQRLAVEANESGKVYDLVRLWVAVMIWGSGTSNGRGPWRTAQGLTSRELCPVLQMSVRDLGNPYSFDNFAGAYGDFRLTGSGESFFTKWFWAVSLCNPRPTARPLILDVRVRHVLKQVLAGYNGWVPPKGPSG
jgi:hypothetical protein